MALARPEEYDTLALVELAAASATDDPVEKKRRLNQAAQLATLAELGRGLGDGSHRNGSTPPGDHPRTVHEDAAMP